MLNNVNDTTAIAFLIVGLRMVAFGVLFWAGSLLDGSDFKSTISFMTVILIDVFLLQTSNSSSLNKNYAKEQNNKINEKVNNNDNKTKITYSYLVKDISNDNIVIDEEDKTIKFNYVESKDSNGDNIDNDDNNV